MKTLFVSSALALALASGAAAAPPLSPAPTFPKGDTTDVLQGVKVADPYRALEDSADPKVQAWSDAQNVRTRAYLDNLPGRAAVAAKILRLTKAASPRATGLQPRGKMVFALYADPAKQQPWLIVMNGAADPASRRS